MRLDSTFRLSTFLTLVLASACLAYAEEAFLPGIVTLVVPVGVLLAIAFIIEERWAISLYATNIIGLFVAAGAGLWMAYHLIQPTSNLNEIAPMTTVSLPYLGPVLMVLMLAIMFRTKKVHDFWWLHTVGLLEVTLACVLASEPFFGVLLFSYLTCVLWSLSLYYLHREQRNAERREKARAAPGDPSAAFNAGGIFRSQALAPWRACRWALVVSALAVTLFLCLPRLSDSQWDPFTLSKSGMSTGYSEGVDLNHSGQIRVSDRVAFEVFVQDAEGNPKSNLGLEQYWRGSVMDQYYLGRWLSRTVELPVRRGLLQPGSERQRQPPEQLPDLGPTQFFVTYNIDTRRTPGLFLGEPVLRHPWDRTQLPVVSLTRGFTALEMFQQDHDGTLLTVSGLSGKFMYKQVIMPLQEAGLSLPVRVDAILETQYSVQPIIGIREWTADVLQSLVSVGRLEASDFTLTKGSPWVTPEKRQRVARVLTQFLEFSGGFTYSLNLRRKHLQLDPTEDFLINVKQGHCERFASGLALMLRSCNIPARVVNGYRGVEPRLVDGQNDGRYVVRQKHAHSWVEALVTRERDGQATRHWLTLDPTPPEQPAAEDTSWFSLGWFEFLRNTGSMWRNFILEYNSDRRSETAEAVADKLVPGRLWGEMTRTWWRTASPPSLIGGLVLALIAALTIVLWRFKGLTTWVPGWRSRPLPAVPAGPTFSLACYERLLALMNQHFQLAPRRAQTPREFAAEANTALRRRPATTPLADVPNQIVLLLYRARYGQQPLTEAESSEMAERLGIMEGCLTSPA